MTGGAFFYDPRCVKSGPDSGRVFVLRLEAGERVGEKL